MPKNSRQYKMEAAGLHRHSDLRGLRLLVVEDTVLIAMEITMLLRECGCEVVGPASSAAAAAAFATEEPLDGAILDINLAGETCFGVAKILDERDVPFIFLSGYDDRRIVPASFHEAPKLNKPFDEDALVDLVDRTFYQIPGKRKKHR